MGGWPKSSNPGSIRVPSGAMMLHDVSMIYIYIHYIHDISTMWPWCAMMCHDPLIRFDPFRQELCQGPLLQRAARPMTLHLCNVWSCGFFLLVSSSLFRPLDKFLCDAVLLSYVVVYCIFHASFSYSIFWIPLGLLVLAVCWFVCLVLLFREHPSCQPKPQKALNLSRFPSMRIHMGKVKKRVGMRALWHHKVYNVARHHFTKYHKMCDWLWQRSGALAITLRKKEQKSSSHCVER